MALAAAVPTRARPRGVSRSPERSTGGGRDRLPLSREEKEPTGTIVRPVLCRGGGYEEVPPPEPLPPPDVPPMGGHAGGGV